MPQLFAEFVGQLPGNVTNVISAVAIAGKGDLLTLIFEVPQPDAGGQDVHLASGIIDVVFAMDIETGCRQKICDHRAIGGAAAMSDVQGACWVCGNKLNLNLETFTHAAEAISISSVDYLFNDSILGFGVDKKINEAGPCDLGLQHCRILWESGDQSLGKQSGVGACGLGQSHCEIGRKIPVFWVARTFHKACGYQIDREDSLAFQSVHRGFKEPLKMLLHKDGG